MNGTTMIEVDGRDAVPKSGRVAWLELHGLPPGARTVCCSAPLALWELAGADISTEANVSGWTVRSWLEKAPLDHVAGGGGLPLPGEAMPEEWVMAQLQLLAEHRKEEAAEAERRRIAEKAEIQARALAFEVLQQARLSVPDPVFRIAVDSYFESRSEQHLRADGIEPIRVQHIDGALRERYRAVSEQRTQENARRLEAANAERDSWIASHGSERLRLALAAGLTSTCSRSYVEERLALELPGWRLASEKRGEDEEEDSIEPTLSALTALAAERAAHPGVGAKLVWLTTDDSYDTAGTGCEALAGDYLGAHVVFEIPGGRSK